MNNNDCGITVNLFIRLIALITFCTSSTTGSALYSYGTDNGDTKITFSSWAQGSEQIDLDRTIPFLGNGKLTKVWINTVGSVTYYQLMDSRIETLVNNIAIAPFHSLSIEGANTAVYYRQTMSDSVLFTEISNEIATTFLSQAIDDKDITLNFKPTWAMIITWYKVASVTDATLENTFQLVLTSDGSRSFALYNYADPITWTSANGKYAAAGIYIATDTKSMCSYALQFSQTEEVFQLASSYGNSGSIGRHVLIISEPLKCENAFESDCNSELPTGEWGFSDPYFSITDDSWDVYALFRCKAGLFIRKDVSIERIDCIFEPDYYMSSWGKDPSKCIDLNSTRTFDIGLEISKIGDAGITWMDELLNTSSSEFNDLKKLAETAITKLFEEADFTDVIVTLNSVSLEGGGGPQTRSESTSSLFLDVTINIPTYIRKTVTSETIDDLVTTLLNDEGDHGGITFEPEVTVSDLTDSCLQGCLCRIKTPGQCKGSIIPHIQPDACCGGCDGKPYATSINACCDNRIIYNPSRAVCCSGRVRQGLKCP